MFKGAFALKKAKDKAIRILVLNILVQFPLQLSVSIKLQAIVLNYSSHRNGP